MTKSEGRNGQPLNSEIFDIRASDFIRHSSFSCLYKSGSWSQFTASKSWKLSMIALRRPVRVASPLCEKRPVNRAPAARGPDLARLRQESGGRRDHARLAAK